MSHDTRVAILGLDAGDRLLIERWAGEGRLPFFARLLREGTYAILDSTAAVFSGSPWLSLATGCNPAKCGVYTRHQLESGTYNVRRIKAGDLRKAPFWVSFTGPVAIVDIPKAPLLPGIDGIQLVEWGCYDHYSKLSSTPERLVGEVLSECGSHPFSAKAFEEDLHRRRDFDVLRRLFVDAVRMKRTLHVNLMRKHAPRLFFSVFGETHAAGHAFWRFQDPRHPAYQPGHPFEDALLDIYREVDDALAEFAELFGQEWRILVLSGHGFTLDNLAANFTGEVLVRAGFAVPRLKSTAFAAYTPSLAFDMSRSRAFFLPTDSHGFVRINLRGREPGGIVDDIEYRALCDAIAAEFASLHHPESGAPVVREVVRVRDTFAGEFLDQLPDLSILWQDDRVAGDVVSPRFGLIPHSPDLSGGSGTHRGEGFLLMHGAGPSRGPLRGSLFDVAPLVCRLLGETDRTDWDGRDSLWTAAASQA